MVLVIWFQVILTPFHVFDGHPAAVLRYLQKEQARRGRIHAAVYATGMAPSSCPYTLHLYPAPVPYTCR